MLSRIMLVFITLMMTVLPAMAIEEPQYRVRETIGSIEVREYAPYLVAETRVAAPFDEAGNQAFSILAGYIFGNNRSQQKMEMTAPVSQRLASEKVEMTAPVAQRRDSGAEEAYVFSFVMPARYTRATLPDPLDPRVQIREMPMRVMAVLSFSGTWSQTRYAEHESQLLDEVTTAGLKPAGEPVFARYNSPFTLWFLRRNEVMIEIQP